VDVLDSGGRLMRRVVPGGTIWDPGLHPIVWNGDDGRGRRARAGIYFVTVRAGNERVTRRVVLVP
jgi:hypothetical protein